MSYEPERLVLAASFGVLADFLAEVAHRRTGGKPRHRITGPAERHRKKMKGIVAVQADPRQPVGRRDDGHAPAPRRGEPGNDRVAQRELVHQLPRSLDEDLV